MVFNGIYIQIFSNSVFFFLQIIVFLAEFLILNHHWFFFLFLFSIFVLYILKKVGLYNEVNKSTQMTCDD